MPGAKQQFILVYFVLGTIILSRVMPIDWRNQTETLRDCILLAWGLSLVNIFFLNGGLGRLFGIRPRRPLGLLGIPLSPLFHRNLGHLIANTLPFAVLGWLMLLQGQDSFYTVTATILLIGGIGTWLFGRDAVHLGASGLIFGYMGYLVLRGYLGPTILAVGLAVMVILLYGGQLLTLLPGATKGPISWEGHLFGFLGGVMAAMYPDLLTQVANLLRDLL
ncbi:rhomboid family intramembrane serine protease [Romeria aff. gracilis LEGE 07310]|uniref:Rhomboid family intramembrane serine protease n=1 Tax=Vasconcelosia minhoensis LEGE 07310 TaxID=915328 RepID=A0A8J7A6V2_9CYAN|nr:rhomboid family intramembrane serine protease [Romeria gracilis]MBE9077897.1 rhomboid family intramembrane serine protease [Romeria aff. gracilis LEGE 07310]